MKLTDGTETETETEENQKVRFHFSLLSLACFVRPPLTELVSRVVDELAPVRGLYLPLVGKLDVVPARKAVLQIPLRFAMSARSGTIK